MAATFQRLAPVVPVRDLTAALAHDPRLGFQGHVYAQPGAWVDPKTNTSACCVRVGSPL